MTKTTGLSVIATETVDPNAETSLETNLDEPTDPQALSDPSQPWSLTDAVWRRCSIVRGKFCIIECDLVLVCREKSLWPSFAWLGRLVCQMAFRSKNVVIGEQNQQTVVQPILIGFSFRSRRKRICGLRFGEHFSVCGCACQPNHPPSTFQKRHWLGS